VALRTDGSSSNRKTDTASLLSAIMFIFKLRKCDSAFTHDCVCRVESDTLRNRIEMPKRSQVISHRA
jgi:hypothetical protein